MVFYLELNILLKGGFLIVLCLSVSGVNGLIFMNEVIDFYYYINDDDMDFEELIFLVMNCMG